MHISIEALTFYHTTIFSTCSDGLELLNLWQISETKKRTKNKIKTFYSDSENLLVQRPVYVKSTNDSSEITDWPILWHDWDKWLSRQTSKKVVIAEMHQIC